MDQAAFKQELKKKNNAIVKLIKSRKTRRLNMQYARTYVMQIIQSDYKWCEIWQMYY
jgi:hypothetical protein